MPMPKLCLICAYNKPYVLNCQDALSFFDLSGGLTVCNLFLFGETQAPTMPGRFYTAFWVSCCSPVLLAGDTSGIFT